MRKWKLCCWIWCIICSFYAVLCNRRENAFISSATSHTLRHSASAIRHMLGHEIDNTDNVTSGYTQIFSLSPTPSSLSMEFDFNLSGIGITLPSGIGITIPEMDGPQSKLCQMGVFCQQQNAECLDCNFNYSCVYGEEVTVECWFKKGTACKSVKPFLLTMKCRYCYQTDDTEHTCKKNSSCHVVSAPREKYTTKCTVNSNVLCLGNRVFQKNLLCNWTKGYSWRTALLLSIVLGGFGVDRFYLGMWQEGIGKLFSFGGLGVWTLVDVILIASGYLGPADSSLYIY